LSMPGPASPAYLYWQSERDVSCPVLQLEYYQYVLLLLLLRVPVLLDLVLPYTINHAVP
jgi:hypothetical protein